MYIERLIPRQAARLAILAAVAWSPAPALAAVDPDPCTTMVAAKCAARWQALGFASQAECFITLSAYDCGGGPMPGSGLTDRFAIRP